MVLESSFIPCSFRYFWASVFLCFWNYFLIFYITAKLFTSQVEKAISRYYNRSNISDWYTDTLLSVKTYRKDMPAHVIKQTKNYSINWILLPYIYTTGTNDRRFLYAQYRGRRPFLQTYFGNPLCIGGFSFPFCPEMWFSRISGVYLWI